MRVPSRRTRVPVRRRTARSFVALGAPAPELLDRIDDEIRQRFAGAELQGKSPLELLSLYFERQAGVSAERREQLLARAQALMTEGAP